MTDHGVMSRDRLVGLFHGFPKASRLKFVFKQVMRFALVFAGGLYVYYFFLLISACQILRTAHDLIFCPLVMKIYAEEAGPSFKEYVLSLHAVFIAIVAAAAVVLWAMKESKPRP